MQGDNKIQDMSPAKRLGEKSARARRRVRGGRGRLLLEGPRSPTPHLGAPFSKGLNESSASLGEG